MSSKPPIVAAAERLARLGLATHWLVPPPPKTPCPWPDQLCQTRAAEGPCTCPGKAPRKKGWAGAPWTPPDEVDKGYRHGCNLGIHAGLVTGCPRPVVGVDFDSPESWRWGKSHLPPTPIMTGSRRAEHWYYAHPGPGILLPNKAHVDGMAIDLRGDGGNLVVAPSVHPSGHVYSEVEPWTKEGLAAMPVFDIGWFPAPARPAAPVIPIRRDEQTLLLRRASAYLAKVPVAVQGKAGGTAAFKTAAHLIHELGLTAQETFDLMMSEWNPRCDPPFEAEGKHGLRRKVQEAADKARSFSPGRLRDAPPPGRPDRPPVREAKAVGLEDLEDEARRAAELLAGRPGTTVGEQEGSPESEDETLSRQLREQAEILADMFGATPPPGGVERPLAIGDTVLFGASKRRGIFLGGDDMQATVRLRKVKEPGWTQDQSVPVAYLVRAPDQDRRAALAEILTMYNVQPKYRKEAAELLGELGGAPRPGVQDGAPPAGGQDGAPRPAPAGDRVAGGSGDGGGNSKDSAGTGGSAGGKDPGKGGPGKGGGSKGPSGGGGSDSGGGDKEDDDKGGGKKKRGPSQASQIVTLALAAGIQLFHTPDKDPYVTLAIDDAIEHMPIKHSAFGLWLGWRYHEENAAAPGQQAVAEAKLILAGRALYDGPEYPVACRLALTAPDHYLLDLCDPERRIVSITPTGWKLTTEAPVKFRRPKGMLALPEPSDDKEARMDALRPFVNVDDDQWALVLSWLVAALRPVGSYPLLILGGEQGSGKTSAAERLRELVDPHTVLLRSEPGDVRDLMIAAANAWVVGYDNLSSVPAWLSDALCRLSTGGGFGTRALYTDDEETLWHVRRPVLINGISDLATRSDLLDRALPIALPKIVKRRTEEALKAAWTEARPKILGALLTAVSGALKNLPTTVLEESPRMADFALWSTAAEHPLGMDEGAFLRAYAGNRAEANEVALDASPIVPALRQLLQERPEWLGTAADLLRRLTPADRVPQGWPKDAIRLSGHLKRIAPNLRAIGIEVKLGIRAPTAARTRLIRICTAARADAPPAQAELSLDPSVQPPKKETDEK